MLTQFIACARLSICRKVDSKGRDGNLNSLFNSIFQVGLAPADLEQGFNASSVSSGLIPIKGIRRKSHHLAGLGNIAKLGGEIEKPGLVFDDVLIETFHWEFPWVWCPVDGAFTLPSKRRFPFRSRDHCQIKSKLTHI